MPLDNKTKKQPLKMAVSLFYLHLLHGTAHKNLEKRVFVLCIILCRS